MILNEILVVLCYFLKFVRSQNTVPMSTLYDTECYNFTASLSYGSSGSVCFDFNVSDLKEISFYTHSSNNWNSFITGIEYIFSNETNIEINVNKTYMKQNLMNLSNIEITGFKIGASNYVSYLEFQFYDLNTLTHSFGPIIGANKGFLFWRKLSIANYLTVTSISGCFGSHNSESSVLKSIVFGYFQCQNQTKIISVNQLPSYWSEWRAWTTCLLLKKRRSLTSNQTEILNQTVACDLICELYSTV